MFAVLRYPPRQEYARGSSVDLDAFGFGSAGRCIPNRAAAGRAPTQGGGVATQLKFGHTKIERFVKALANGAVVASVLLAWQPVMAGAAEKPIAAERNPPGDIPDTQVFVTYQSPLGFSLKT